MDLFDELQTGILCGDGAIGTLLMEQGIPLTRCFEELCVSEPERIEKIHQQYISAGAKVIETNTFGANAVSLERFGLEGRVAEINRAAAQIATKTARRKDVHVAGSVGPLGIDEETARAQGIDRAHCFREQIIALVEGGAGLIFFETFMDCDEMAIAFQAWKTVGAGLAICSFACTPEGRISGMSLVDAFAKLRTIGARMVGVNCTSGPDGMVQILKRVPVDGLLAAYPSAGEPKFHEGRFAYDTSPDCFAESAREMVAEGVRLIGGCCGTTPSHIAALAAAIRNLQPVRTKPVRVGAELPPVEKPRGEGIF